MGIALASIAKGERRRLEILEYVRSCNHGVTLREISAALGIRGKSCVHRYVNQLIALGVLGRSKFHGGVFAVDTPPSLVQEALRLSRGLVDTLGDLTSLDQACDAYEKAQKLRGYLEQIAMGAKP